jgi:hypothetical protein
MLTAWGDLRGGLRRFLASRPSEADLLMVAMLSGLFHFLGEAAKATYLPARGVETDGDRAGLIAGLVLGSFLIRTLGLYILAVVAQLAARAAGGHGTWRESRSAVFWAALVAGPVALLAALGVVLAGGGAPGAAISSIGSAAFAIALAFSLAEAHGFRRAWVVLLVIAGLSVAVWGSLIGLGAM